MLRGQSFLLYGLGSTSTLSLIRYSDSIYLTDYLIMAIVARSPYSASCNDQNSRDKLENETIRQLIEMAVNTRHDLMHMHTHIQVFILYF